MPTSCKPEQVKIRGHPFLFLCPFCSGMTDDEVKANAIVFLLAGFNTTATALSFTIFLLAANPQILLKAQKEVDDKLGKVSIRVII